MRRTVLLVVSTVLGIAYLNDALLLAGEGLQRLQYAAGAPAVDLGVGLWAWPMAFDWDGDGDLDLVVSCPDVPFNGTYLFENPGGNAKLPVFKPPVRVGPGFHDIEASDVEGETRLLVPGHELVDFRENELSQKKRIYPLDNIHPVKVRGNQWRLVDYDGDGVRDLIVGVGDWSEYGWDNAFNAAGEWTNGPLHGYVYLLRNGGTNEQPQYAEPEKLQAGGAVLDVYGAPTPNFGDFDGDGDLDLLCGEFMDGFNYFENVGTRTTPEYAAARRLVHDGRPLAMDLQMIIPTAVDWDRDGDLDLIVGDEDGRVALVEHAGQVVDGLPQFLPPVYFQQEANALKFGALVAPVSFDWDGDGDEDLLCGNTAGHIGYIENLDGGNPPRWAPPVLLEADGKPFRIQAGVNGSIQGPCEAKWGYTTFSVADWDGDGLPDVVLNSILGRVAWLRNIGTRTEPQLAAAEPVDVAWDLAEGQAPPKPAWTWWTPGKTELAPEWRTTPVAVDWTGDGLCDLVMLDHEGYLALFERFRDGDRLRLKPGRRAFRIEGDGAFDGNHNRIGTDATGLRLNAMAAGKSGRRKLCVVDWNNDGRLDLIVNSTNANLLLNVSESDEVTTFRDLGPVDKLRLAGHDTSPTTVDWDGDGVRELLLGAEDGHFYYLERDE
ncbi:FG-GAP repeat domain-containing protein [Lacipirellula sp.]|uniref:FG-GAP repeat domain-containing protein n=1 Tax=Lacipirellula sp. TaxID=2691419 RepID=UPI003D0F5080